MLLSERKNCVSEKRTNKQTQEGKTMKKKDLVFLANELNEVLELEDDDVIDADQDPKKLEKELKKCVAGNKPELEIFAEDEFSDEAWELLAELGNEVAILKCEAGEDETGEDEKDEEETGEDETGEEEEVVAEDEKAEEEAEEIQEERPKKRVKVKKKAEEKAEEIEEQEFYFKGREKPKKNPAEKKEKKEKAEKKTIEKTKTLKKPDCACIALKNNPKSFEKATKEFIEMYNSQGKSMSESAGKSYMKIILKILSYFDVKFSFKD